MVKSPTKRRLRYVHIEENKAEVARIQQTLQAGGMSQNHWRCKRPTSWPLQ